MVQREPALAVRIPRAAGQREDRYMHLLCGEVAFDAGPAHGASSNANASSGELEVRIAQLEALVDALQQRLGAVEQRFDGGSEEG